MLAAGIALSLTRGLGHGAQGQDLPLSGDDLEHVSLMETAPWRVARRWAATAGSSSTRPTVVTHSARTFPTLSDRAEPGDNPGEAGEAEEPAAQREAEGEEPHAEGAAERETDFLTAEDVENLERITPTPQECRLLWAGLLEIQDEEAMQEDTTRASQTRV